jgi:hypothetical protein
MIKACSFYIITQDIEPLDRNSTKDLYLRKNEILFVLGNIFEKIRYSELMCLSR